MRVAPEGESVGFCDLVVKRIWKLGCFIVGREDRAEREGTFASRRLPERTYLSKSFPRPWDKSVPVRIVHKVFDPETETDLEFDGTHWLLYESPKGRVQFTLVISRHPGHVSDIRIERIQHYASGKAIAKTLVHLTG